MSLKDIKGQDEAVGFLNAAIKSGKLSHAYIFAGPKGCGRSSLARDFAKALNCEDIENAPCDHCSSCKRIDNNSHPDVEWIRKDKDDKEIKIEQVRALEGRIILKPYEGRYKIYIVADAELMSLGAANSFLKTLEEPPANSLLILITGEPKNLLPTIVSRCQIVRLRHLPEDEAGSALPDVLEEFAGDACIGNYAAANRGELSIKLKILAGWYRDLLIFKATKNESLLIHHANFEDIKKSAMNYNVTELMDIFESVVSTKEKIESNVNPKLALAAMFIKVR